MYLLTLTSTRARVGTTTTAVNLAAELAAAGERVCLVDLDPAASATRMLGVAPAADPWSEPLHPIHIGPGVTGSLLLSAGGRGLAAARGADLRVLLERAADHADHVVADTPVGAGTVTTAAVEPARVVLAPLAAGPQALADLRSIAHLLTILVGTSPALRAVLVRVRAQDSAAGRTRELIAESYPAALLETQVPEDADISNAAAAGAPVRLVTPAAASAERFRQLALELLREIVGRSP